MTPATSLGTHARTLKHVGPGQVLHRLRAIARRKVVGRRPDLFEQRWKVSTSNAHGVPAEFRPIDAVHHAARWSLADLAAGSFDLLNDRRDLGDPVSWSSVDASQLWLFHLHYWEWAWSLAAEADRAAARAVFASHWASWNSSTTFGRWDAWAPYPTSLRAWVLVNVHADLAAGTDLDASVVDSIALHAGFLEHNVELDVGGNHLIKNIKGLVGCAEFLGDPRLLDVALRHLEREIAVQVLADGGHYELSPSYHCQVLVDLIDIAGLLSAAGHARVGVLDDAIERMRSWLDQMLMPGRVLPLLNDCEPVEATLLDLLGARPSDDALTVLVDSGYVIARSERFHLVADVGQPGPSSPPGHIHADCLSFELAIDGERVVVDSGTSEYGYGPRRQHERSTAAHNTVEVDGTDQTEVWGAFRAGRRASATLEYAEAIDGEVTISASHDGYRHLPGNPIHHRTWTLHPGGLRIADEISGGGRHRITSRIIVAGGHPQQVATESARGKTLGRVVVDGPMPTSTDGGGHARSEPGSVAEGFGRLVPATVVALDLEADLPVILTSEIRFDDGPHGAT